MSYTYLYEENDLNKLRREFESCFKNNITKNLDLEKIEEKIFVSKKKITGQNFVAISSYFSTKFFTLLRENDEPFIFNINIPEYYINEKNPDKIHKLEKSSFRVYISYDCELIILSPL